ncbi:TraB/VirB10 family protein [Desulfurobacterium crinifex]
MAISDKRKKQLAVTFALFLSMALVLYMLMDKMQGGGQPTVKRAETFEFEEVGTREAIKTWYIKANERLDRMEEQLAEISATLSKLNEKLQFNEKKIGELNKSLEEIKKHPPTVHPDALLPEEPKKKVKKVEKSKRKEKEVSIKSLPPLPPPPRPQTGAPPSQGGGIKKVSFEKEIQKRKKEKEKRRYEILRKFYIPSGTFVEGILLSGLDAPTGMGAKRDTIPVLINLVDNSILPNDWKQDLKDCRVIGEAYGDLSSERVYIRTDYMSCVDDEGNVYDFSLDGYVAGEDGKVGLRGRVVSKQGALIARAFLSSFFEGAGNVLQTTATTTTITGSGVVSSVQPGKIARAGVFAGFAESARRLSDYYMKLLDQTFPVIEIGAGRKVTIVVQRGKWIQRIGKTEKVEKKKVRG